VLNASTVAKPDDGESKVALTVDWKPSGLPEQEDVMLPEAAALDVGVVPGASSLTTLSYTLRAGQHAYVGSFHLDCIDNVIVAIAAGRKRAVLLHPEADRCLHIDYNSSHPTYRQSPLPLLKAREWLALNCPPGTFEQPVAWQHMFEEGDVLFIPRRWLHSIETGPAASGWWFSLNRFLNATGERRPCDK